MSCIIKRIIRCEAHNNCQVMTNFEEAIQKLEEACGTVAPRKNTWQPPHAATPDPNDMLRRIRCITEVAEQHRLNQVAVDEEANAFEAQLTDLLKKNKTLSAELQEQQLLLTQCNATWDKALMHANREAQTHAEERLSLIHELIRFRDHLDIFMETAVNEDQQLLEHLLLNLSRETASIFERNGVEVLNGTGPFSTDYQEVASVVHTDDPALEDVVESTFSDGYRIDKKLYRPQKVNLYTCVKTK